MLYMAFLMLVDPLIRKPDAYTEQLRNEEENEVSRFLGARALPELCPELCPHMGAQAGSASPPPTRQFAFLLFSGPHAPRTLELPSAGSCPLHLQMKQELALRFACCLASGRPCACTRGPGVPICASLG